MRLASRIRRHCLSLRGSMPAMPLTLGVMVGQVLAWFASDDVLAASIIILGCFVIGKRRGVSALIVGCLVGLISCAFFVFRHVSDGLPIDGHFMARVIESPSRRKPGEVTFVAEELSQSFRRFRCRAVDLPWRNVADLREGDVVWIRGEFTPVEKPLHPFSWQSYLWRRRIAQDCKARFVSKPVFREEPLSSTVRSAIMESAAGGDGIDRGEALFLSMVFGFKDLLSADIEEVFKELGLSHILVVSGYQVSLVFAVCAFLTRWIARWCAGRIVLRSLVAYLAWGMSLLYVALIGFESSAVRALIAAACVCASLVLERASGFAQRWWVALLIVTILVPWSFFEVGVILTFAALAGIGIGVALGGAASILTYLVVNIAVWSLTSCVMVVWNGSLSLLSVALNLIVPGPWSLLNCTVGMIGLLLVTLGLDTRGTLLGIVTATNEYIATLLEALSRSLNALVELKGAARWGCVGVLMMASSWLLWKAVRANRIPVRLLGGRGSAV